MRPIISFPDIEGLNRLSKTEKINLLLTAASLAPSTINTQPWLFKIEGNRIELFLNPSRHLPVSDSSGRQAYISLGACWANLELLAQSYGLKYRTEQPTKIAINKAVASFIIEDFKSSNDDSETREAIIQRHTNRFPFEKKPLPLNFVQKIKLTSSPTLTLHLAEDGETKNEITPIVLDSVFEMFSKKDWSKELSHWVKPGLKKYEDGMPGYYLGVPLPISFLMPLVLKYGSVAKMQLQTHKKMLSWVGAYGVITASENNPLTWFLTGEMFEKIAIEAQKNNIKVGILTAPTEIETYSQKLKKILGTSNTLQMFFRLGFTEKTPIFSPRLPINKIIKV